MQFQLLSFNLCSDMKASSLFKRYVWMVDTIRRAKRITLAELNERWQRTVLSEGTPMSRSTFNRHRDEIEEIFDVIIQCDDNNCYYIEDNDMLRNDTVQQWMLSTLTVSNIVGEARSLHNRILLENIPTDGESLRQVVEAMQLSVKVKITYRRYGGSADSVFEIEPYCIKLFRRRWYLLCHNAKGFMVLSFDRMTSLEITDETFEIDASFNAEAYFSEYFGVMSNDRIPLQRLVLRAFGNERFSMKDLPLHHSQKIVEEADDHIDYELTLRPTSDFLAYMLSRGRWLKVIEPEDVAQQIQKLHEEAISDLDNR